MTAAMSAYWVIVCVCVKQRACDPLTGVATSPESGLWSTERGVCVAPNSEYWDEWDLGKLPLRVFTPEELRERERERCRTLSRPRPAVFS